MAAITERDERLLRLLGKYGLLTTSQLSERIFPGVQGSTVLRRLRALESTKLLYRVKALESGELVWLLSNRGEEKAGVESAMIRLNRNSAEHDVQMTRVRMTLESLGLGQNFLSEWTIRRRTFRRNRDPNSPPLVPDGIFTAEIWNKEVLTIALELELHAKSISRYDKIFGRYQTQDRLDLVWYFVKTKGFGQALFAKWQALQRGNYTQKKSLCFTVLGEFDADPRQARIHFMSGRSNSIEEFFAIPAPAQSPAQAVGRESDQTSAAAETESAKQNENLPPMPQTQEERPSPLTPPPQRGVGEGSVLTG